MLVKRLSWAGILIQSGETVILIDPLGQVPKGQEKPLAARLGESAEPFISFSQLPKPTAIVVTHIHPDHFDADSIQEAFGADVPVYVPRESVEVAKLTGLNNIKGISFGEREVVGDLKMMATYSADGYGTPQVAWVIEGDGQRILHCGDTLWHGFWWRMVHEFGPINIAFLPINGAVLTVNGLGEQSEHQACMTPEEAVEAAKILSVERLIPIHYGMFHNPPYYAETANAVERLKRKAQEREIQVYVLQPGEELEVKMV